MTERARHEYPEYTLDFDEKAWWKDRACPSPEALADAKRVGGIVVWLTEPPFEATDIEDYYYGDPWEPREAVVIEEYLKHRTRSSDSHTYYPEKSYRLIQEM